MKNGCLIGLLTLGIIVVLQSGCNKDREISTLTLKPSPWVVYGSMTDRDGNAYKTLHIGSQTWMVENLKTTKYNDGKPIPVVTDPAAWNMLSTPACCWQQNNPAFKVTYGLLYNWYTVDTKKLCPAGWHIPTDEEWTQLTDYLGGEVVAGGKLKESGFSHWYGPNTGATNETYFRALPGGYLNSTDSLFQNLHEMGCWWTSDGFNTDLAATRVLYKDNDNIRKVFFLRNWGLSVRCVWDYYY
jgi:uncharacterized protein (TIGR02145 family)